MRAGSLVWGWIVCAGFAVAPVFPVTAQDDPMKAAIRSSYKVMYNALGLMEYCLAKGYVQEDAVARTQAVVKDADAAADFNEILGVSKRSLTPTAKPSEDLGRRGTILGPQTIGLIDMKNPAHPEQVPDGQTMGLADNARAQGSSERELCAQMAAKAAPP